MIESINPSKLDNPFDQFYLMLTFATKLVFKTLIDLVFEQVHANYFSLPGGVSRAHAVFTTPTVISRDGFKGTARC